MVPGLVRRLSDNVRYRPERAGGPLEAGEARRLLAKQRQELSLSVSLLGLPRLLEQHFGLPLAQGSCLVILRLNLEYYREQSQRLPAMRAGQ